MTLEQWWARVRDLVTSPEWFAAFLQSFAATVLGAVAAVIVALLVLRQQLQHDRGLAAAQRSDEQKRRDADTRREAAAGLARALRDADHQLDGLLNSADATSTQLSADLHSLTQMTWLDALARGTTPLRGLFDRQAEIMKSRYAQAPITLDSWPGGDRAFFELQVAEAVLGELPGVRAAMMERAVRWRALGVVLARDDLRFWMVPNLPAKPSLRNLFAFMKFAVQLATDHALMILGDDRNRGIWRRATPVNHLPHGSFRRVFQNSLEQVGEIADELVRWDGYLPIPASLAESRKSTTLSISEASVAAELQELSNSLMVALFAATAPSRERLMRRRAVTPPSV